MWVDDSTSNGLRVFFCVEIPETRETVAVRS